MPDVPLSADWPAIFAEVRAGVLSKGEICRKYGIDANKLKAKTDAKGIVWGELRGEVSKRLTQISTTAVMDDAQIVGIVADRQLGVIKSHLTLTRKLHLRLADLMDGYDELVTKMREPKINQATGEEEEEFDAKGWISSAQLLDGITKIAKRITDIEMNTLSVNIGDPPDAVPAQRLDDVEDAIEASLVYQRIMSGD